MYQYVYILNCIIIYIYIQVYTVCEYTSPLVHFSFRIHHKNHHQHVGMWSFCHSPKRKLLESNGRCRATTSSYISHYFSLEHAQSCVVIQARLSSRPIPWDPTEDSLPGANCETDWYVSIRVGMGCKTSQGVHEQCPVVGTSQELLGHSRRNPIWDSLRTPASTNQPTNQLGTTLVAHGWAGQVHLI